MRRVRPRLYTRSFADDQALRTVRVQLQHPVPDDLHCRPADPGREVCTRNPRNALKAPVDALVPAASLPAAVPCVRDGKEGNGRGVWLWARIAAAWWRLRHDEQACMKRIVLIGASSNRA